MTSVFLTLLPELLRTRPGPCTCSINICGMNARNTFKKKGGVSLQRAQNWKSERKPPQGPPRLAADFPPPAPASLCSLLSTASPLLPLLARFHTPQPSPIRLVRLPQPMSRSRLPGASYSPRPPCLVYLGPSSKLDSWRQHLNVLQLLPPKRTHKASLRTHHFSSRYASFLPSPRASSKGV